MGFSIRTLQPASIASRANAKWVAGGVMIWTASGFRYAAISLMLEKIFEPSFSAAHFSALPGSLSTNPMIFNPGYSFAKRI